MAVAALQDVAALHGCGSSVLYFHKGHHRAYSLCQHIFSQQRPQVVHEFDLLWLQPARTAAVCQAEVPISGCLHKHMLTSAYIGCDPLSPPCCQTVLHLSSPGTRDFTSASGLPCPLFSS